MEGSACSCPQFTLGDEQQYVFFVFFFRLDVGSNLGIIGQAVGAGTGGISPWSNTSQTAEIMTSTEHTVFEKDNNLPKCAALGWGGGGRAPTPTTWSPPGNWCPNERITWVDNEGGL